MKHNEEQKDPTQGGTSLAHSQFLTESLLKPSNWFTYLYMARLALVLLMDAPGPQQIHDLPLLVRLHA